MASALVLVTTLYNHVTRDFCNYLKTKACQFREVDQNLKELKITSTEIEKLFSRFDCWQVINDHALVPSLHDLLRNCYDTEDLLDEVKLGMPPTNVGDERPVEHHPVLSHILKSGSLTTIPHRTAKLQKRLNRGKSQVEKLLPESAAGPSDSMQPGCSREPLVSRYKCLLSDKGDPPELPPGRRSVKETIVAELTSTNGDSKGVSIVGMDGLGKTSLARNIRVDETIKNHFQLILSASVSGDFEENDTAQKLVANYLETRPQEAETGSQPTKNPVLKDLLVDQKTLIILDDVWSTATGDEWSKFKGVCSNTSNGSKILITTCNPKVADETGSTPHHLDIMGDEDCKEVIMKKLEWSDRDTWTSKIEDIVKSCCMGMPIIADMIGLELNRKRETKEKMALVNKLLEPEPCQLKEFRILFPSLCLNKLKLPPELGKCIAYCSLFPPNLTFNRDDLIQSWDAEGFIQSLLPRSLNPANNQPFDDLLSRSILQLSNRGDSSKQPIYKMTEFSHEFARLIASKVFHRVDKGTEISSDNIRHLSLKYDSIGETLLPLLKKIKRYKSLRTFRLLHQSDPKPLIISKDFLDELERLRLLDLSHTNLDLSKSTLSKHLRYLDLSNSTVTDLPTSICHLCALKILKLQGCKELLKLPTKFNQLISLTHLYVTKKLGEFSSNMGELTSLEVLDCFVVGKDEGKKVEELKRMKCLTEIQIFKLQNIKGEDEAAKAELSNKTSLETLTLEWDDSDVEVENVDSILEALQPHNHLMHLTVRNYGGNKLPKWLGFPSRDLLSIFLDGCRSCQDLPSLGHLPHLENLKIHLFGVQDLDHQFCEGTKIVFKSLRSLEFHNMEALVRWTKLKKEDMPELRVLKFSSCPILVELPSRELLSSSVRLVTEDCKRLPPRTELTSNEQVLTNEVTMNEPQPPPDESKRKGKQKVNEGTFPNHKMVDEGTSSSQVPQEDDWHRDGNNSRKQKADIEITNEDAQTSPQLHHPTGTIKLMASDGHSSQSQVHQTDVLNGSQAKSGMLQTLSSETLTSQSQCNRLNQTTNGDQQSSPHRSFLCSWFGCFTQAHGN